MAQVNLIQPQIGLPDTTEDPKIQNAFTAIVAAINGGLDPTNLAASLAQSAAVNQSGQTVKGASIIATSESRTNVAYGLMPTPDQVTGIVLPAAGLITVWYQATWQSSVSNAGRAAIFIGSNQLTVQWDPLQSGSTAKTQAAAINDGGNPNTNRPLASCAIGLAGPGSTVASGADVTTGQAVAAMPADGGSNPVEVGGSLFPSYSAGFQGGPCYIFAAAGTYTVSVQFKASSGSVTASNRRLYAQAISFA